MASGGFNTLDENIVRCLVIVKLAILNEFADRSSAYYVSEMLAGFVFGINAVSILAKA